MTVSTCMHVHGISCKRCTVMLLCNMCNFMYMYMYLYMPVVQVEKVVK